VKIDNSLVFGTEDLDEVQAICESNNYGCGLFEDFGCRIAEIGMGVASFLEIPRLVDMTDVQFENWLRVRLNLKIRGDKKED